MLNTLATHGHGWDGGPGPWLFIPFSFALLWITVIALAIWRFRRGGPPWARHDGHAVLAERYARGDIDADEFRARRDVLREGVR